MRTGSARVRLGGKALAAFGHDEAQRLDEIRVRVEHPLHRRVADFKDFSLFEGNDVGGPGLPREERHLTEEVAFIEGGDIPWPAIFTNLDADSPIVNYKHRGTRVARPDDHLPRRKYVSDCRLRQHRGFVCR